MTMPRGKRGRGVALLRVLRVVRRLDHARYAPTLSQLATDFEVSERTIRRDLELLEEAGFAIPTWRQRAS